MTFLLNNAPLPMTDPISRPRRADEFRPGQKDPLEGLLTEPWAEFLSLMALNVQRSSTRLSSVSLTSQAASISATDLTNGAIKDGLYRVTYYARIMRAAGISSSLDVTLSWTDGGVAQSQTGASITGNSTTSLQSVSFLIHADASSPINYATVRVSAGVPSMLYRLDVVLEVIDA